MNDRPPTIRRRITTVRQARELLETATASATETIPRPGGVTGGTSSSSRYVGRPYQIADDRAKNDDDDVGQRSVANRCPVSCWGIGNLYYENQERLNRYNAAATEQARVIREEVSSGGGVA